VNGKKTAVKDVVHYTDHEGIRHAARIEQLAGNEARLNIFHSTNGSNDTHLEAVPHSATGVRHSWNHLPD
jgi:hypothetical protein